MYIGGLEVRRIVLSWMIFFYGFFSVFCWREVFVSGVVRESGIKSCLVGLFGWVVEC